MLKKALIHIGMHKCGTTSIQNSLKGFDDGVTKYAQLKNNPNHSIPFQLIFTEKNDDLMSFKRRGFGQKEIAQEKADSKKYLLREIKNTDRERIIFCGEAISSFSKEIYSKKMIDFFDKRNIETEIYVYVRSPAEWRRSLFQQQIKVGNTNINQYLKMKSGFRKKFHRYKELFREGRFSIKKFDRDNFKNRCVVADFCSLISIQKPKIINSNESLSFSAIKLLFLFNKATKFTRGNKAIYLARRDLFIAIRDLFAGQEKIDINYFQNDDSDDLKFLKNNFSITFNEDKDGTSMSHKDLRKDIENISNDETSMLDELLDKNEINLKKTLTPQNKINALFNKFIENRK